MNVEKVQTNKIDGEWLDRLRNRGFTCDTIFDVGQYEKLKHRLLALGGEAVILPPVERDYENIMERGTAFLKTNLSLSPGRSNECHKNAAKLWAASNGRLQIGTGYGLSEDGAWRQHSWAYSSRDQQVHETTEPMALYFGFILTDEEAAEFETENRFE